MPDEDVVSVAKNVAKLFINTIKSLSEFVAKRDSRNQAADSVDTKLSPVVPQDLIKICNAEFCAIEHRKLLDAAHNKMVLR
eukprot:6643192-Ditylum_brightwellii.AAC.1